MYIVCRKLSINNARTAYYSGHDIRAVPLCDRGFASMRYSIFNLMRQALSGHRGWGPAWRDAAPKPAYDIVIVGGGGIERRKLGNAIG